VAVTAIEAELAGMNFVGKWHRLSRLIAHAGVFRSEVVGDASWSNAEKSYP
jgi:hypothetical protein